jgi:hypothetical protein
MGYKIAFNKRKGQRSALSCHPNIVGQETRIPRRSLSKKAVFGLSQDSFLREGRLTRRELLKMLGYSATGLALGGSILGSSACKGGSPNEPPPPPAEVTVRATFFNHTQGPIGEKLYTGISGQPLVIITSDISAGNVDQSRIAVREASSGFLGKLVGFSRSGEVQTNFPSHNGDYHAFLMNLGPTTSNDYAKVDEWIDKEAGRLAFSPAAKWHREDKDGYTGPEEPINDAFFDLNSAIKYSWANYGSDDKVASGGDFGVGYYNDGRGNFGEHTPTWAGVNPERCGNDILKLKIFLEELFEIITLVDDLGGHNTYETITNPATGHLNEIGGDLFAYVHVKDDKTAGSSSKSKFSLGFD